MSSPDFILLLILLGAMAAYIPVFICLIFAALAGFLLFTDMPVLLVFQTLLRSLDNFALVVVLFFILCGNVMTSGKIVEKLIRIAQAFVGFLPGGLGMAGILACAFFGAISGSTVATVVAIGGFMIPALKAHGYPDSYSAGVMTTAPNLGVIIPPSIGMILYSMISNVSLEGLFLTGFLPGILITAATCLYTAWIFRNNKDLHTTSLDTSEMLASLKDGIWALLLPVIIFGGIFSGVFTANEAAVVASAYAIFVEVFIHKAMNMKRLKDVVVDSAVTSAALLIIVAGATVFGRYMTLQNIPGRITEAVLAGISSPEVLLLLLNILLLFVGMFMDIISATLILGPVLLPIIAHYGIDPMHFGLIMTVNLALGYCTPPVGVSLFIAGSVAGRNLLFMSKAVMPFLIIQILVLLLLTYFPTLVLLLPRFFGYHS
ncbi:C4-dicarboxylate transporter DctM subunit [Desulfobotulus alkaliphilus]|uniref:C4-dicarboxylate transporter DctM subunit n=1 Tax=Desulfobotulus alkaliphilus TaxID=622671 RepID=A0A562S133_9BACT|nr:TRAP transporter large permease subunit [Desulfobotulus alkaliphilus]TWI74360.1 C4-dicarboxylate transporter DctM subunit [Desulfobotulus alkaliphilus]